MARLYGWLVVVSLPIAAAGCVTVVSAPGAAQVRETHNAADVGGCTPLGNIQLSQADLGDSPDVVFRNRVVGLGGNTGLITKSDIAGDLLEGIAYRCPAQGATPAK
jgi:hypothetical protein